jgi:hypothetical protein
MTKKDFITVSAVIKRFMPKVGEPDYEAGQGTTAGDIARALATEFASINPRFDYKRFYEACGLK